MALKDNWADNVWQKADADLVGDTIDGLTDDVDGLNLAGPFASLPAASFAGRLYFCTDVDLTLRDNGTSWVRVRSDTGGGSTTAPPDAGWTNLNLGTATIQTSLDGRLLTVPTGTRNVRGEYRTLSPTSDYIATLYLEVAAANSDTWISGIILRESSSGSFVSFGPTRTTSNNSRPGVGSIKWTDHDSNSANYLLTDGITLIHGVPRWYRIRDDGTNRYLEFSYNGNDWIVFTSHSRTDFITPNQIGWGLTNEATGADAHLRLRSFEIA